MRFDLYYDVRRVIFSASALCRGEKKYRTASRKNGFKTIQIQTRLAGTQTM